MAHLLSLVPGEPFRDLGTQILADGLFHILMYVITAAGLWLLWRRRSLLAVSGWRIVAGGALLAGPCPPFDFCGDPMEPWPVCRSLARKALPHCSRWAASSSGAPVGKAWRRNSMKADTRGLSSRRVG
ncbi:DUF2243 domain-containing protein [Sphingomonas zeicaulis]|uniref:DUF2243 domain-containing protein n=1 Tax=Sphingomonas zeicaulis TaxID=1632740 RepID=UPI003D256DAA